jgi:hypothetical protein
MVVVLVLVVLLHVVLLLRHVMVMVGVRRLVLFVVVSGHMAIASGVAGGGVDSVAAIHATASRRLAADVGNGGHGDVAGSTVVGATVAACGAASRATITAGVFATTGAGWLPTIVASSKEHRDVVVGIAATACDGWRPAAANDASSQGLKLVVRCGWRC